MARKIEELVQQFLDQLNRMHYQHFYIDGMQPGVDFRSIRLEIEDDPAKRKPIPILLSTGWGSGWEGILPLAFSLACRGYRVILVSLPGYGDSENPPRRYYREHLYRHHAQAVLAVLRNFGISKAYFVGHSMGAEILAEAAWYSSEICEKLVLFHPTGLKKIGFFEKFSLFWKFTVSGARLRWKHYRGLDGCDKAFEVLIKFCGEQRSPWWGRFGQRWAEFSQICQGGLIKRVKEIKSKIIFISGSQDTVYNAWKSRNILIEALTKEGFKANIIFDNPHNPTLYHSERTANIIVRRLSGA